MKNITDYYKQKLENATAEYSVCNATYVYDKDEDEMFPHFEKVQDDFVSGVDWQRNKIWHSADDIPTNKFAQIIVTNGSEAYISSASNTELHETQKWAYLLDILPTDSRICVDRNDKTHLSITTFKDIQS